MEPKRSKYDTNPLDTDVADRATESFGSRKGPPTEGVGGRATSAIGRAESEDAQAYAETEAPTRRIDDTSYPSIFVPAPPRPSTTYQPPAISPNIYQPPPVPPPSIYQPPPFPVTQQPGTRTVAGLNIPEKWANVLPYVPFYIGLIASIVELILVPRSETRTRFHAAQGLALQGVILAVGAMFSAIGAITDSGLGSGLFGFAAFVFLIVSMIRVAKGNPHHIAPLDELSKWLNEKIKPRK